MDRSLAYISLGVVVVHGLALLWAALTSPLQQVRQFPPPKRLIVQTISLSSSDDVISKPDNRIVAETPRLEIASEPVEDEAEEMIDNQEPQETGVPSEDNHEPILIQEPPQEILVQETPPEPLQPSKEEASSAPKAMSKVQPQAVKPKKKDHKTPHPQKDKPEPKKEISDKAKTTPKAKTPTAKNNKTAANDPKPAKKTSAKKSLDVPKKNEVPNTNPKTKPSEAEKIAAEQKKKLEEQQRAQKEKQQQLLTQAQERIAKISQNRDKLTSGPSAASLASVPSALANLQIDAMPTGSGPALTDREICYRDELANRLKLQLRLPEFGDVKVKLTLDRSGKVSGVVVVSAESAANRKYIEKTLPSLVFPAFGLNFGDASQFTFSITLSNE